MIYFIHGHNFEWPYEKEITVKINECNQPTGKTKEVIFPTIKNTNSLKKFYINDDSIYFDKLIYKYLGKTFVQYGFIYKEICKDSFWENLLFTIDIILKKNPDIENIQIPISLFPEYQSCNAEKLFKKIYAKLSTFSKKTIFILLSNKKEIRFIYNECNFSEDTPIKGKELESILYDKDAQILSAFRGIKSLYEPLVLKYDIDIGLGICDYKQLNLNLNFKENDEDKKFPVKFITRFEDGISKYYKKNKPETPLKAASYSFEYKNFKTYIRNPIEKNKDYKKWFLEDNYVPYERILKAAKIMNFGSSDENKEDEESFFKLFGYYPNYKQDAGRINYHKNAIGNLESYKKVIQLSNNTLVKEYEYDNSEGKKKPIDIQKFIKERENTKDYYTIFDAWKVFNSINNLTDSDREQISRYYTKNTKNYLINRRVLFFLVMFLNLNLKQAEAFFRVYDCILGVEHLDEDKVLIDLLKKGRDFYNLDCKRKIKKFYQDLV